MIQQLFVWRVDSESVRMFSDDLRKRGRAVPGPGFSHSAGLPLVPTLGACLYRLSWIFKDFCLLSVDSSEKRRVGVNLASV
jgi:hypothetical protein